MQDKLFMTMPILSYKYGTFLKAPVSLFELFITVTPNFEYAEATFMNNLPYGSMMLHVKTSIPKWI